MKILAVSDVENKGLWDYYEKGKLDGYDLIISCGDVKAAYLEFLESVSNVPLLYVRGNHDDVYQEKPPLGCVCIEDDVVSVQGLRVMGLGGSMKYRNGDNMFTEREMAHRLHKLLPKATMMGGIDVLVTHAPAAGYGDMEDIPHRGFQCFNEAIEKLRPVYHLHGHVHKEYGHFSRELMHESGTKIINCYDKIDIAITDDEYPSDGETGSFIYDLYQKLRRRN